MKTLEKGKTYSGNQIIEIVGFRKFQDMKVNGSIEQLATMIDGGNAYRVKI